MDKSAITVTMPVTEYESLVAIKENYDNLIMVLERANPDGQSAVMTEELEQRIKDIYC